MIAGITPGSVLVTSRIMFPTPWGSELFAAAFATKLLSNSASVGVRCFPSFTLGKINALNLMNLMLVVGQIAESSIAL